MTPRPSAAAATICSPNFARCRRQPGKTVKAQGDVDAAIAQGGQLIEAEFVFPYLAHAAMEPLNGFIHWQGDTASARYGCQFPTPDHAVIAEVLGIGIDKVKLQTILAGGSFGRRAQQTTHVARELAEVAKAIGPGRPIKLVWTREDDMRGGYYRPFGVHRMRGVVKRRPDRGLERHHRRPVDHEGLAVRSDDHEGWIGFHGL